MSAKNFCSNCFPGRNDLFSFWTIGSRLDAFAFKSSQLGSAKLSRSSWSELESEKGPEISKRCIGCFL